MQKKLDTLMNKGNEKSKDYLKLEEGDTTIRILPSPDGDPFKQFFFHYGIGEGSFLCPKRNGEGAKCAVCDFVHSLYQEGTDDSKKQAKDLRAKERYFSNVIVRGKEAEGSKVFGYGKQLYEKLIKLVLNPEYDDITDVDNGIDLMLSYTNASGADFAKTECTPSRKNSPVLKDKKEVKKLLDGMKNIASLHTKKTSEEAKAILDAHLQDPFSSGNVRQGSTSTETAISTNVDTALAELTGVKG